MAYIIQDATLSGIADAIRAKDGTTDKIKVSEMAAKIGAIKTSGGEDKTEAIIKRTITEYSNDKLEGIGENAFARCTQLKSVAFPAVASIGDNAFARCTQLKSISFPLVGIIGSSVFSQCSSLESVDLPNATQAIYFSFSGCSALKSLNMPLLKTVGANVFEGCEALEEINLPALEQAGYESFTSCSSLKSIKLPKLTSIGGHCFVGCHTMTSADFSALTKIGDAAFFGCDNLATLVLRSESICSVAFNSFANTIIDSSETGYIYVPRSLVDKYKSATNWSEYASHFRALEDYTVDGTITGELDTTKI